MGRYLKKPKRPLEAELEARAMKYDGAISKVFTAIGYDALAMVICGKLSRKDAMTALGWIRDIKLDRNGDILGDGNYLIKFFKKFGIDKNIDWSTLPGRKGMPDSHVYSEIKRTIPGAKIIPLDRLTE